MKVLEMLERGDISSTDAAKLLAALGSNEERRSEPSGAAKKMPRYLRVTVGPDPAAGGNAKPERVNVRVPLAILKAGVKISSLIPGDASGSVEEALSNHGINLDLRNLDSNAIDELIFALSDLEMDVTDGKHRVRVFAE
jgi:hypothetical protein